MKDVFSVRFTRKQLEEISTVFSVLAGQCQADALKNTPTPGIDDAFRHFHGIAAKAAGAIGWEAFKADSPEIKVLEKSKRKKFKKT
jgi:hypothetical protein